MMRVHLAALVGLAWSPEQRLRSVLVLVGSGFLFGIFMGFTVGDWGIKILMLFLTAMLLVQWRSTLFHPASSVLDLPIPLRRASVEWLMSGLQAVGVGAVAFCLKLATESYHPLRCGLDCSTVHPSTMLISTAAAILVEVVIAVIILVPTITLCGRFIRGMGAHREIFVWASGPALAALSEICIALLLPKELVYGLWLAMFVAIIITAVMFIGRMVSGIGRWRQRTEGDEAKLYRTGQPAECCLVRDSRAGIVRALALMVVCDVAGWALLWFSFSSWMFHDVGLDGLAIQNYVAPVGLALLVGVRVLAVASLLGQVGLVGGLAPWASQPWALLPLSRSSIQRALLRHIGVVSLVAIGLNIAFMVSWGAATEDMLWSEQHVQLRGLIGNMVQVLAVVTGIMAMAFMVVGTGLRNTGHLLCVGVGAMLSVFLYVVNVPVPGVAAAYVPIAVANAVAIAAITALVWGVGARTARRLV